MEILISAALVFLVFRGRVPMLALNLIVLVPSPVVAWSLVFFIGTIAAVFTAP